MCIGKFAYDILNGYEQKGMERDMTGKLYGIGVGPGDPELLTLKAVRKIKECDYIVVPGEDYRKSTAYKIACSAVPELQDKQVFNLVMPMTKDKDILKRSHESAAGLVRQWLDDGKDVGFLTLGDVSIYSTYLYIQKLINKAGCHTEMISGIPSFCAAAARLNIGLSEASEQIHIIPASYQIEDALKLPGTKILMKSGKQIGKVKEQVKALGLEAVMIENCGMDQEKVYRNLDEIDHQAGYYSLMIVKDKNERGEHTNL